MRYLSPAIAKSPEILKGIRLSGSSFIFEKIKKNAVANAIIQKNICADLANTFAPWWAMYTHAKTNASVTKAQLTLAYREVAIYATPSLPRTVHLIIEDTNMTTANAHLSD